MELDGAIDPTFDPGAGANGPISSIVRQPDGKLLVGGAFSSFAGTDRSLVVRLNSSGSLDPTFSRAITSAAPATWRDPGPGGVRQLLIQSDGKVLVAGAGLGSGSLTNRGVLRLKPDGALDPEFLPPTTLTNAALVEVQSDRKVLVVELFDINPYQIGSTLIRLDSDGSRDGTFAVNPAVNTLEGTRRVSSLVALPDDQILVGGAPLGLRVLAPNGQAAAQQISLQSDLVRWQTITNSFWELQGKVFKEMVATNEPQRFYRVVGSP